MGKYPFYFHGDKLEEKVYRRGDYTDYWFHCAEDNSVYGEHIVFPLIESVIARCLHPNPEYRPELKWIVYVLRLSLIHI